jgi:cell division protein FtsN
MADDRFTNNPYRPNLADDEYLRAARRDADLQADPELGEGPASSGKVALFAVAIAVVLGAVFYGLNNTSTTNQASNAPTSQTAQTQPAKPAAPSGMRDVTPRTNTEPGVTTGAAPSRPAAPAPAAPSDGGKSQ